MWGYANNIDQRARRNKDAMKTTVIGGNRSDRYRYRNIIRIKGILVMRCLELS